MPGAPRFTQKPSIQQTPQGDLLMECYLEADPPPDIVWNHGGTPIVAGPRVELTIANLQSNLYKAVLIIKFLIQKIFKEPNVGDGGAYKCTASNQFGESNANINLNFAGAGDEQKGVAKGPTFLSKPRIIPKDGGALIVMECRVKSASKPHGIWYKNGVPIHENALYSIFFSDLGDSSYLLQLELHASYLCNIKNNLGETNANLTLNFEQEPAEQQEKTEKSREKDSASPRPSSRQGSRPGSPKKQMKSREGTPRKSLKSREGTPRKSIQSRTATPTQETDANVSTATEISEVKTEQMEVDNGDFGSQNRLIFDFYFFSVSAKRKSMTEPSPKEKKSRQKSPRPKSKSPRPETPQMATRTDSISSTASKADQISAAKAREMQQSPKNSFDKGGAEELTNKTPKSTTTTKAKETKANQITKRSLEATDKYLEPESNLASESEMEKSTASNVPGGKKHSVQSKESVKKKKKDDQKSESSQLHDLKSEAEGREVNFFIFHLASRSFQKKKCI
uniref:Ig-like domain-containing protein n=1 Tax=Elaeophora elaphi TaxID=1147741 RepID=A0A0R3RHA4_9BILA